MSDKQITPIEALNLIWGAAEGLTADGLDPYKVLARIKRYAGDGIKTAASPTPNEQSLQSIKDEAFKAGYQSALVDRETSGVRWVKATTQMPPIIKNREKIHIKYKGRPDLLVCYYGKWYWNYEDKPNPEHPVEQTSWQAIEWLDESSPSPVQPKPIDTDELWNEHSETIGDDIDSLSMLAGKTVMGRRAFNKAIEQLTVQPKQEDAVKGDTFRTVIEWLQQTIFRGDERINGYTTSQLYNIYQQSKSK